MTLRQQSLIRLLLQRAGPVNGGDLARALGITTRTLRTDVRDINDAFRISGAQVQATARSGYWISEQDRALFATRILPEARAVIVPNLPEEREIYLYLKLLTAHGSLTMDALAEEMFTSKTTVSKDVHHMQELVRCVDGVSLEISQQKGFCIRGEEQDIFKLISTVLLYYQTQYTEYLRQALAVFCGGSTALDNLHQLLRDALLDQKIILTARSLNIFVMEIFWELFRKKLGFVLQKARDISYTEVALPLAEMERLLGVTIGEVDRVNFLQALVYKRFMSPAPAIEEDNDHSRMVIDRYYALVRQRYGIDLSADAALREHLTAMLYYASASFSKKSLLADEMRRSYPYAWEVAQQIAPIAAEVMGMPLKDNEIGRLAARVAVVMDKTAPKKRTLAVVDSLSYTDLFQFKIQSYFSHKVELMAMVPAYQLESLLDHPGARHGIELVLTTVPLPIDPGVDVLTVSPFLNQEDITRINDYFYHGR